MPNLPRIVIAVVVVVLSGIFAGVTVGIAQTTGSSRSPATTPNPTAKRGSEPERHAPPAPRPLTELTLPSDVPLPTEFSGGEAQQARIREALRGRMTDAETGDPVLDELLQVIRKRGSVLDGSSLAGPEPQTSSERPPARARAAESMLRAARRLEQIDPLDKNSSGVGDSTAA